MHFNELYFMYKFAHHLIMKENFDLIHIDQNNEIWIEKYDRKTSHVIRLTHHGFDWQNHLRKDIALVFQKAKNMKRLLKGKNIFVHNIYISTHAPVDSWENLKQPMQLKEKNPVKMNMYYLHEEDFDEELLRLQDSLGVNKFSVNDEVHEDNKLQEEIEERIKEYRNDLFTLLENKRKAIQEVFSYGKPFFTYVIILINLLMFYLLETSGGSTSIDTLIDFGAKYNPDMIEEGQWWRIVSSMFLHIGLLHFLMNMLAVYYLGTLVEKIYGRWRFLFIYFLAGIGGGIASFAFSMSISAGASGAIFGLFGALLFFGLIYKQIFFQTMGLSVLVILAINIVFGFMVQQIDMAAHLGGLIAGFVASVIFYLPKKKNTLIQFTAVLVYGLIISGLVVFGVHNNFNSQAYHLMVIEKSISDSDFEKVVDVSTEALDVRGDLEAIIYFQRAYAYIELNEAELAIQDLEESITYEGMPEAYYNLALLYYNNGEIDKAEENIRKAYSSNPEQGDFIQLYEEITGESL
ncbi:rhomboid family intramembrane serine protease [Oceanobacillus salinisoli]|uniref:rhomboid family intramembrane serine protease n=1 Tax=Oceanobacillus salinisoli TaxID=2678611 RepID=UPI0012E2D95C|nr:rhomboid family intramembrane serine protease [Oceanobacillus salinisoli]